MKRRHVICLLALLIVQAFYTNSFAVVEWDSKKQ